MASYITHLECANCGERYDANLVHGLCVKCQRPLWVRYDLDSIQKAVSKSDLANRPQTMWRYRELLPIKDDADIVSLAETVTPLVRATRLAAAFGVDNMLVKDESRL